MVDKSDRVENFHNGSELTCELKIRGLQYIALENCAFWPVRRYFGGHQRGVIVAALNLVLDFDLIESGARAGAPKYMEWYGGFALMVTLIWLYFELLRLLSKIRSWD